MFERLWFPKRSRLIPGALPLSVAPGWSWPALIATPVRRPPELTSISEHRAGRRPQRSCLPLERFHARDGTELAYRHYRPTDANWSSRHPRPRFVRLQRRRPRPGESDGRARRRNLRARHSRPRRAPARAATSAISASSRTTCRYRRRDPQDRAWRCRSRLSAFPRAAASRCASQARRSRTVRAHRAARALSRL